MKAVDEMNKAKTLYLDHNKIDQAALVLQRQALVYFGVFQKFERWQDPHEQQVLETALNLYRIVLDSAVQMGLKFMVRENAYWVAHCQYEQWRKGRSSSEVVLGSLISAELFADQHRNELSVLQGLQAIITKQQLSSEKHVRDIYRFAIQVCRGIGDWEGPWNWVQKSKARSLSDILGLGILIPRAIVEKIEEQEATKKLFEEEGALLQRLSDAPSQEKFQIRVQLDTHQKNMREHKSLQELLNLREGISVTLDELRNVSNGKEQSWDGRPMVFVDWIITEFSIFMCVVTTKREVVFRPLKITRREIQQWADKNMNGEENFDPDEEGKDALCGLKDDDEADEGPLRDLDDLILPLGELSDPDDLLVLCPSGILHSFPLHALRVDPERAGIPLVMRNPIFYCASLTAFAQCCRRAAADIPKEVISTKSLLAVYEPGPNMEAATHSFDPEEQQDVYSSVKYLTEELHAEVYCGNQATCAALKECLENDNDDMGASYTVKDFFDLRIRASHISLFACGSVFQHFEAGDEPLGLVTALLSAGAASVLGTLWPVESRTARVFSERFYAHLKEAGRDKYAVYDLAYAVREAIADVRQFWDSRHPYHWASFVLHGAWFMKDSVWH
ncbi:MAG: hypothetical protein Q9163_004241 [Psora crenata]